MENSRYGVSQFELYSQHRYGNQINEDEKTRQVAYRTATQNAYKILMDKSGQMILPERPGRTSEDNIKMDLNELSRNRPW